MKKEKFILFLMISMLHYSCRAQKSELVGAKLNIMTPIRVKCNQLTKLLPTKEMKLSEEESQNLICLFAQLQPAEDKYGINARVSGTLYDQAKEIKFCMSNNIILINGKKYFLSKELRAYVLKIMRGY